MSSDWQSVKLDSESVKKVLNFLFGEEVKGPTMDTRTEIKERETFQALAYYRALEEGFDCKAAGLIANILERLAISTQRMGRIEGVEVLKQQYPKEKVLPLGVLNEISSSGEESK
jgi:hypothetical protein